MAGFGYRPVRHLSGASYNGQFSEYVHLAADAAAIFVGSLVKMTGTTGASGAESEFKSLPVVAVAAAGDAVVGVCVGVKPVDATSLKHCAASTLRTIYVADDPKLIFAVQEDAVGGAVAAASVGQNADTTAESGSTTTGVSTMELDSSTAVAAVATLRIHRLVETPTNVIGATAAPLTIWEVIIGEHQLMEATLQIGTGI